jgi:hypothetical protein
LPQYFEKLNKIESLEVSLEITPRVISSICDTFVPFESALGTVQKRRNVMKCDGCDELKYSIDGTSNL